MMKVRSILREIQAGNVYQVNLTNSLVNLEAGDHRTLYRNLLNAQQPAHGALIELDGVAIVSASPELFFEWDGSYIRSRPMKGTIRRGRWSREDHELASELLASPKERAENVMIVDLIRNDLGKVANLGTVSVSRLLALEAYPNVWQMVSEVSCETRRDVELVDIFDAMFPCGSVTGAPKRSAMKIIQSLESTPRGIYCGAIGLLQPTRLAIRAQFSVAIRTAVIDQWTGEARFGSGGGIVADSQPEREFRETVLKAGMLDPTLGQPFRLLETFRHSPQCPDGNLDRHLARLRNSAQFFGFRLKPDLDGQVARRLAKVEYEARVRLLLSRSGRTEIQIAAASAPREAPVTLMLADEPVDSQSVLLFHKTSQRGLYARARRRFPDADDVILVNERGECTETTTANLVVRVGSTWFTPQLSCGCLPGIERARLIDQGVLVESSLTPRDLRSADELAVINSLRGWQDAVLLDAVP